MKRQNEETLALAKKYLVRDHGVTAMDLAGAEALFPTVNYLDLFEEAKAAGIPYTVHAGGGRWAGERTRGDSDWNKNVLAMASSQHGG